MTQTKIEKFNIFLNKHLKYILAGSMILLAAIYTDRTINAFASPVSSIGQLFFQNICLILFIILLFSKLLEFIIHKMNLQNPFELNPFFLKNLIWFVFLGFLIIGIVVHIHYGKATPEFQNQLFDTPLLGSLLRLMIPS